MATLRPVIPPSTAKQGAGPAPLPGQNPKTKRYLLLGGAAAVLALLYLLSKRGQAPADPAAQNATTDPTGLRGQAPSTFADNGGQAAQLGTDITAALGVLTTASQQQTDAFGTLTAQLQADHAATATAGIPGPPGPTGPSGPAGPTGPSAKPTPKKGSGWNVAKGIRVVGTAQPGATAYKGKRKGYLGAGGGWHPGSPPATARAAATRQPVARAAKVAPHKAPPSKHAAHPRR